MKGLSNEQIDAIGTAIHGVKVTALVLEDAISELSQPRGAAWEVPAKVGERIAHFTIQQAKAIEQLEPLFDRATSAPQHGEG